jgi:pSer/pThr/pTyr-binding forkhead associated (FHA) protein
MPARLVPLAAGTAPTIALLRPVLLVGRHPECDVRIDLPQISRRHCCFAQADDRLLIRDLGSTNGVRVNGHVIDEIRLHPGDEVAIAQVLYRLEDPDAAARPKPAPKAVEKAPDPPKPKPAPPPSLPDIRVGDSIGLFPLDD